jgi:hypothetical protein
VGVLRALTASGKDLGVAYLYERSFPVPNITQSGTIFVPIFAVLEQNGDAPAHMLIRTLYDGVAMPCPLYYASTDCTGAALGMNPVSATGFACAIDGGHAGRADPTAMPSTVSIGSYTSVRHDGFGVVRWCTAQAATTSALPVQDLGAFEVIADRVYMAPAQ